MDDNAFRWGFTGGVHSRLDGVLKQDGWVDSQLFANCYHHGFIAGAKRADEMQAGGLEVIMHEVGVLVRGSRVIPKIGALARFTSIQRRMGGGVRWDGLLVGGHFACY